MDDKEYTQYQEIVNTKLSENIDPDCEEFYFAELEAKANSCDKYRQSLNEIKGIINDCKKLMPHEFDWEEQADNILEKIDKILGEEK